MLVNRIPQSKSANAIFDEYGIVIKDIKKTRDKTGLIVPLVEVPKELLMSEDEFKKEFGFSYQINWALNVRDELKQLIMNIINVKDKDDKIIIKIEEDEISLESINCKLVISQEEKEHQDAIDVFQVFEEAEWDSSIDEFLIQLRGEI